MDTRGKPRDSWREEKDALAWLDKNQIRMFDFDSQLNHRVIPVEEKIDPPSLNLFEEREQISDVNLLGDSTL